MRQKVRLTVVVGVAALLTLGLILFWPQAPLDSALSSPDVPPTRVVCYGYIDCREGPLFLQTARAGRILEVFAKERQTVIKDAPLVQIDDHLVRLQEEEAVLAVQAAQLQLTKATSGVKQYQARQAQAEAALEAANNKVLAARYALDRKEELVRLKQVSQVEADVGRAQLNEARALVKAEQSRLLELKAVDPEQEVKLAQLQLNRSQVQLEAARQERKEYVLRAPVDGLVLRVQVQEGDLVGPTSPRPAIWLSPGDACIVRAEVSQEFAGRVHEGLDVQVEDEASGRLLARGRISAVSDWFLPRRQFSALPTSINTGLTLECVIDLPEGYASLRLGQRVRVRILADQPVGSNVLQEGRRAPTRAASSLGTRWWMRRLAGTAGANHRKRFRGAPLPVLVLGFPQRLDGRFRLLNWAGNVTPVDRVHAGLLR
jgi:multidrug resistance efflux pump